MSETWTLTGMDELNANIQKLVKAVDKEQVKPILEKAATTIADAIRANAPVGPTGNLKRSIITHAWSDYAQANAMVGIDYRIGPHAHLLEYGTVKMSARPFFRPGWDTTHTQVEEDIKTELLAAVDKAA